MSTLGFILWFTGLSGSGKTTLAKAVRQRLLQLELTSESLDPQIAYEHLFKGLGFLREDRETGLSRLAFVGNLLARNGVVCVIDTNIPYASSIQAIRRITEGSNLITVYLKCSLEVCRERDPNCVYARFDKGEIRSVPGLDDAFEEPIDADLILDTQVQTIEQCVSKVLFALINRELLDHDQAESTIISELRNLGYV